MPDREHSSRTEAGASWPREECHLLNRVCVFSGSNLCRLVSEMLLPVIERRPRELPLGAPAGALKRILIMKECLSSAEGVIRKNGEEFDTGSAPEVAS